QQRADATYEAYTRAHVFAPLGMSETAWRLAEIDLAHLATPYEWTGGAYRALPHDGYPDWPAGTLHTSVMQYARFLIAFIQDGVYRGVRVLGAASAREMKRAQIPELNPDQGLVFYYEMHGGARVLGHNGADPGVSTIMGYDPASGAGAIVFTNGN